MRLSLLLFFLLPLIEIAGFVVVGGTLGILPTLVLTVVTSVIGVYLLRRQGTGILQRLEEGTRQGKEATRDVIDGAMIIVAAILLLVPGYFTDFFGLLLFVPAVRRFVWSTIQPRMTIVSSARFYAGHTGSSHKKEPKGPVVDLETDEFQREPHPSSPWRKMEPPEGT